MEWQPIETSPKDGTWFLLYRLESEPVVVNQPSKNHAWGIWHKINGKWVGCCHGGNGTHWMPLPAPPTKGEV